MPEVQSYNPLKGAFDLVFIPRPFAPFTTFDCGSLYLLSRDNYFNTIDCDVLPMDCEYQSIDLGELGVTCC